MAVEKFRALLFTLSLEHSSIIAAIMSRVIQVCVLAVLAVCLAAVRAESFDEVNKNIAWKEPSSLELKAGGKPILFLFTQPWHAPFSVGKCSLVLLDGMLLSAHIVAVKVLRAAAAALMSENTSALALP